MAFASVGSRGSTSAKVSGATLAMSPTATVPAGALLGVWAAWDNNNGVSADGPLSAQLMASDSVGNVYVIAYSGQDIGAETRAHGAIFLCLVDTAITTSDTITVTNGTSAKVAKAMSLWEFSIGANKVWATNALGPAQALTRAGDPAAVTLGGMTSQEYLLLHVLAAEGPSTDAYTWDADYTQITSAGTTGGADDTNMTVSGGFRIATLTTDTVDVTSDTADRDYTQGLIALAEVDYDPAFPTFSILDNFNRADENPLDNGTWDATACNAAASTARKLKIVSNQCAEADAGASNNGGQWWLSELTTNDAEVFVTLATEPSAATNNGFGPILHGDGCGGAGTRTGFQARWVKRDTGASAFDYIVHGHAGFAGPTGHCLVIRNMAAGVKLGLQKRGSALHCWFDIGAGWQWTAASYVEANNWIEGKLGLEMQGDAGRCDDFGGGASQTLAPQIYRREQE